MAKIYPANLYGLEQEKSKFLSTDDISKTEWSLITPQKPFYLLIPQNNDLLSEYDRGWKIADIFPVNSMGITTGDDKRFVAFNNNELEAQCGNISKAIAVAYRPFDNRQLLYRHDLLARARVSFMEHLQEECNLALITIRRPRNQEIGNFFISDKPTDKCAISALDNAQLFLLYLYPTTNNSQLSAFKEQRRPNLSEAFLNTITNKLGYTPTPEAIFYYIYAIFHSPTYRTRYAEFLKIDFPRVPLTSNDRLFRQLAAYGEELVALHLMKSSKLDNTITQYEDRGGSQVVDAGHPKFVCHSERSEESRSFAPLHSAQDDTKVGDVIINKKGDRFSGVPENVWNFYVGGYQVCQKWLKDRKGRTLSDEDILHYQRIVVALQETIGLMAKIDAAIPSFPIH
jgi:predicted helicase